MSRAWRTTFVRTVVVLAIALVALVALMTGSAFGITGNWVVEGETGYASTFGIVWEDATADSVRRAISMAVL